MKRYKLRIPVPAGKLETVIDDPESERHGLLLVAHPHPLHGGSMDNKVVTTLLSMLPPCSGCGCATSSSP